VSRRRRSIGKPLDERDLERSQGVVRLLQLFQENCIRRFLEIMRPNVAL
jgi:hypothetical protein